MPLALVGSEQTPPEPRCVVVRTAAEMPAVLAMANAGIRHLDLPCTPERVWLAIRNAESGRAVDPWSEPPDVFGSDAPIDEAGIDAAEGI